MKHKSIYYSVFLCSDGSISVPLSFQNLKDAESSIKLFRFCDDAPAWIFEINSKLLFNGRCMIREYITDSYVKNNPDFDKNKILEKLYNTVDNFMNGLLIV